MGGATFGLLRVNGATAGRRGSYSPNKYCSNMGSAFIFGRNVSNDAIPKRNSPRAARTLKHPQDQKGGKAALQCQPNVCHQINGLFRFVD